VLYLRFLGCHLRCHLHLACFWAIESQPIQLGSPTRSDVGAAALNCTMLCTVPAQGRSGA
jgi:hypothetical protein